MIEEAVIEQPAQGGRELVVRMRVHNNSGHKRPTSCPSRRAYLHLTVVDQKGNTVFESGRLATALAVSISSSPGPGSGPGRGPGRSCRIASTLTNWAQRARVAP